MKKSRANPGRIAAARALLEVDRGGHADQLLAKYAPTQGPDRRLSWHLTLGVLRHRGTIDATLKPLLRKPLTSLDSEVIVALRIGTFESLFSRTKAHAVVDQSVEVVKALGGYRAKGFVNAVLRRVRPVSNLKRHERLNHPSWLLERWDARYPAEEVDAWCVRNNSPPEIYVATHGETTTLRQEWEEQGVTSHPVKYDNKEISDFYRLEGEIGPISELPGFQRGAFWVQDVASTLSADFLGTVNGQSVLDACAAPGGKAFRLFSQGARVVAVDSSALRLERMKENLDRLRMPIEVTCHDWTTGDQFKHPLWDSVIVDAPCTGLGTVRRKPEIRWNRTPLDVLKSAAIQRQILKNAAKQVKEGGTLVYSVCSPEPEEGREQIRAFLDQNPAFTLEEERDTAPPNGDLDAFYMARLAQK